MNFKTTLILVLVIGVLIAAVFLLPEQEDPDAPPARARLFPDLDPAKVVRIDLERPGREPATLLRREEGWRLDRQGAEVRADSGRVRDILEPFENLRPRVVVGEASESKRVEYGLSADRRTTIRLHRDAGDAVELHLGITAPQGLGTVYASRGDGGPVVVISEAVRTAAWRERRALRDRTPVDVHPLQVLTITVERLSRDGFRASFDEEEQVWMLVRLGDDGERDLGAGDTESVELLRGLAAEIEVHGDDGFVSDVPTTEELEAFGLGDAAVRVTLTPRGGAPGRTLRIGRREGEGDEATFLWAVEGEPSVYRSPVRALDPRDGEPVEEGLPDLLEEPLDRFRDRNLLRLDAFANAEELRLVSGDHRLHLKRMENAEGEVHWRFLEPDVRGWAQDEDVDTFVRDLKTLRVEAFADGTSLEEAGLGEDATPAATLEVTMDGDEEPRRFTLGDEVEGVGRSLRRGDDELLVVAPPTLLERIRTPWFRFRHHEIRRISAAHGTRIEVVRASGLREVAVRDGDDWHAEGQPSEEASLEAVLDVLATFERLKAHRTREDPETGFVARIEGEADPVLATYGLAEPAVVLRLTYRADDEEKRIALHVGPAVGGRHHARTEGAGEIRDTLVFTISEEVWKAVNRPLFP